MNSQSLKKYSLVAASALLCACVVGERRDVTIRRSWPAAAIKRIEVIEIDGGITVDAGTSDTITLVANVSSRGTPPRKDAENQGYFDTSIDGDTLSIGRKGVHMSFPLFSRRDLRVDYELHVPPSVALRLQTVNGRISSRGVDGKTTLNSVNGAIDVETPGSTELVANTVNGLVEAKFTKDFTGAQLKTVNGRVITILPPTASFSGDFAQVNGDVEASFPLSIHSHPGSRRVSGEVNGGKHELRIVTVNGDIKVENGGMPPKPPAPPEPPAPPTPPAPPST